MRTNRKLDPPLRSRDHHGLMRTSSSSPSGPRTAPSSSAASPSGRWNGFAAWCADCSTAPDRGVALGAIRRPGAYWRCREDVEATRALTSSATVGNRVRARRRRPRPGSAAHIDYRLPAPRNVRVVIHGNALEDPRRATDDGVAKSACPTPRVGNRPYAERDGRRKRVRSVLSAPAPARLRPSWGRLASAIARCARAQQSGLPSAPELPHGREAPQLRRP